MEINMLWKLTLMCLVGLALGQYKYKQTACKSASIANANRKFALDLFSRTAGLTPPTSNMLMAPLVVSMGLSMVMEGANGETRTEMETALKFKDAGLNEEDDKACIYSKYNMVAQPVLHTVARLYGEQSMEFYDEFLARTSRYAGNKLDLVDFIGNPSEARSEINDWVSRETRGRISDLFPEGTIDASTRIAIASVLYFKGEWEEPFKRTEAAQFFVNTTDTVDITFMEETFSALKHVFQPDSFLEFLQLPYKSKKGGAEVSMILILDSASDDIVQTEAKITQARIDEAIKSLEEARSRKVFVAMPVFKMHAEYDLEVPLRSMGLNGLFTQGAADLSGMNGRRDLSLAVARQKTFIAVDQLGTEAAGAFAGGITALSLPLSFICDKPFHFLIHEARTNTVLFMGRVADPTQG